MVNKMRKPHPHLKDPFLYVEWLSISCLTRQKLVDIFTVSPNERLFRKVSLRRGDDELGFSRAEFASIDDAEKTLSCIQTPHSSPLNTELSDKPYLLKISRQAGVSGYHQPVVPPLPDPLVSPCLVKGLSTSLTPCEIYDLLRPYGPIFAISVDEDIGIFVEFYEEEDARAAGRELREKAKGGVEGSKVTLEAYDPHSLFCSNFPMSMTSDELGDLFRKFGHVTSSRIPWKDGRSRGFGFVSFEAPQEARNALKAMNGSQVENRTLFVRVAEVYDTDRREESVFTTNSRLTESNEGLHAFEAKLHEIPEVADSDEEGELMEDPLPMKFTEATSPEQSTNESPSMKSIASETNRPLPMNSATPSSPTLETEANTSLDERLFDLLSQNLNFNSNCLKVATEELRIREVFYMQELSRLRMENDQFRCQLEERDARADSSQAKLQRMSSEVEEKARLLDESEKRVKLAEERGKASAEDVWRLEWVIQDLEVRLEVAETRCVNVQEEVEHLKRRLEVAESRGRVLEIELEQWKEKEEAQRREKESEEARKREVADSKRKMEEMIRDEKEEQARNHKERERQRQMEEERKAREQTERERKARELVRKIKEEQQKAREKAERQRMTWKEATEAELNRCLERDIRFCGVPRSTYHRRGPKVSPWNIPNALRRFELMLKEFETIKFSVEQPLIFENVPWPTLAHPYVFEIEDVAWNTVEAFFEAVRKRVEFARYKALVEKAHRLFHPDRWRSRNLPGTVMNEKLRKSLEVAGNTVSQAITPVWRNSRSKA